MGVTRQVGLVNRDPVRPSYNDGGRQYVFDDDGYRVYSVWLIPDDEPDLPVIVRADGKERTNNGR